MRNSKLFYYGIVCYCFILMFLLFTFVRSLHSMFLVPVTESLGMERSAFSLVFSITGLSMAAALPLVSRLLKRYPMKWIVAVCVLLTSGGFAAFAFAETSWQFYLIAVVVGCGTAGCTNMVASLLINNWFADHKSTVMGIAFTGSGFSVAVMSPVLTALLAQYGWQVTHIFCGALMGLVCLPLTFIFAYQKPEDCKMEPFRTGKAMEQKTEVSAQQGRITGPLIDHVRHQWFFWCFMLVVFFWSVTIGGVHMHVVAYLTDLGHSPAFVSLIYSGQAICLAVAKIVAGMVFDHKGSKAGILCMAVPFGLALTLLLLADNPVFAVLFAFAYGCGTTFTTVGIASMTLGFFGQRSYADILSIANVMYLVGMALGPFLSGKAFDITGSYHLIFSIYLGVFLLTSGTAYGLKTWLDKRYQKEWFQG